MNDIAVISGSLPDIFLEAISKHNLETNFTAGYHYPGF
jgi:hypothetical protein